MKVEKLNPQAKLPERASEEAAGYDLAYCGHESIDLHPGNSILVPTEISIQLEPGTCGMILSRSGLGTKRRVVVTQGVGLIDSDYRGPVFVALSNQGNNVYTITPGERVAQLVIMNHLAPVIEEVTELESTYRGAGGFGSTGEAEVTNFEPEGEEDNPSKDTYI